MADVLRVESTTIYRPSVRTPSSPSASAAATSCPPEAIGDLAGQAVATGCLPPRDEDLARLDRWIIATGAARTDPDEQQLQRRYAVWHLHRGLS